MGRSTHTTVFWWNFLILHVCLHDTDLLDICMKKFYCEKVIFDKMTAMRTFFLPFLQVRAFTGRSTPTTVFDGTI